MSHSKSLKVFERPGRKLGNFFPFFLNLSFRFWLQGKIENSEIRKLGITFPRFSRFPTFPSFRFATFSFSFLFFSPFFVNVFSNSLIYICNYSSTHYFINTVSLPCVLRFDLKYKWIHNIEIIKCICKIKRWQNCEFLSIFLTKEGSNKYIKLLCKMKL